MENKKVALVVVAMVVVLISAFAPLALAADVAGSSDGGNGDLIAVDSVSRSNGSNGESVDTISWVSSNRKTLPSRIFLPKGYLPDGGLGCKYAGMWCGFDPTSFCGNCGCLVGFCFGTGC